MKCSEINKQYKPSSLEDKTNFHRGRTSKPGNDTFNRPIRGILLKIKVAPLFYKYHGHYNKGR